METPERVFAHIMRPENRIEGNCNCCQASRGVRVVYRVAERRLESLIPKGQPARHDGQYTLCLLTFPLLQPAVC